MADGTSLALAHRQHQLTLRAATIRQLTSLWPTLDWQHLDRTFPAWALTVARLTQSNRATSAGLAAAYLRAARHAEDIAEDTPIELSASAEAGQLAASLHVTSVVAAKRAASAGLSPRDALRSAFVQSSGAITRLVLEGGRETLMQTMRADPAKPRWQRIGNPRCDFCRRLIDRGAVYAEDTADFAAHDHCGCAIAVSYR